MRWLHVALLAGYCYIEWCFSNVVKLAERFIQEPGQIFGLELINHAIGR
jgi:hypothetical protein